MQEYFNLNWQRISYALASPQYRQAIWNIWTNRDYTLYGTLTKTNFDLSQWPVSERMRLYVRKDIASQIWSYGVGPTALKARPRPSDPYVAAQQVIKATNIWGSEGAGRPVRGAARRGGGGRWLDLRGRLCATTALRSSTPTGNLCSPGARLARWMPSTAAPGTFNEPWGVAVGADGSVYVTDTWNHRVQKFDANGGFIKDVGHLWPG